MCLHFVVYMLKEKTRPNYFASNFMKVTFANYYRLTKNNHRNNRTYKKNDLTNVFIHIFVVIHISYFFVLIQNQVSNKEIKYIKLMAVFDFRRIKNYLWSSIAQLVCFSP